MEFSNTKEFAQVMDQRDPLKEFRSKFVIPGKDGHHPIYFLGNSLGLQPKSSHKYIQQILEDWGQLGVESFFHAEEPWMKYHAHFVKPLSTIVGALPEEVVVMNQLTVNLHLLLVSFYRPTSGRYKIICEAKAFPSDQYSFETHVKQHGLNPDEAIIEVAPRAGEFCLRTEDIISVIKKNGTEAALILFGGINYYTGQAFDMKAIAAAGREVGAVVGFDLAHAAGNIKMSLHDWEVDFACWCSYKYLNSGPGAIGGAFIHQKHHNEDLPRFAGWWGYDETTRFKMDKGFKPMTGAEGWQLSTPGMLMYATHRAALEIFEEAGWENIVEKRKKLTSYLWYILENINNNLSRKSIELITPREEDARGSQVSMLMLENGKAIYDGLISERIMVDWREPNVIRLAPAALYNTYEEVWKFGEALARLTLEQLT